MLVQSQMDHIKLLPTLPKAWATGSFKGLRARGGITIDMSWEDSFPTSVTMTAVKDCEVKVHFPNRDFDWVKLKAGKATEVGIPGEF